MALFGAGLVVRLAHRDRPRRHRDGARAVFRRQGDDRIGRVRDGRVAADGDRRTRDRPEPCRPARQLPDLLHPARVLVRPARSPHAPGPIGRPRRRALERGPGALVGSGAVEPPVGHGGRRGRGRRDRGQVVGSVRRSPLSGSISWSPMPWPGGAPACGSGRRMPPSARAPPRSCSSCPSPSSSTSAPGSAGSPATAATGGRRPSTRPVTGFWSWVPPALQSLWLYHRAIYDFHVGLTLRARLRQPRLAVAAAAAAHLDVLPVDAAGAGGVRGRQRLRREHLQHAQPADLVRRRRRGALPGVPVRPHP